MKTRDFVEDCPDRCAEFELLSEGTSRRALFDTVQFPFPLNFREDLMYISYPNIYPTITLVHR